jgi:hypothetical protein
MGMRNLPRKKWKFPLDMPTVKGIKDSDDALSPL